MSNKPRTIELYETKIGTRYDAAILRCAHADQVFFTPSPNQPQGILLVDPLGHDLEKGFRASTIFRRIIDSGWGHSPQSADSELCSLDQKLAAYPEIKDLAPAGMFLAACADRLSLANAGLPFPFYLKSQSVEEIFVRGLYLGDYSSHHSPAWSGILAPGEVLFLRTDGVDERLLRNIGRDETMAEFKEALVALQPKSAAEIRDGFLERFEKYIVPVHESDDDATLVVVKARGFT